MKNIIYGADGAADVVIRKTSCISTISLDVIESELSFALTVMSVYELRWLKKIIKIDRGRLMLNCRFGKKCRFYNNYVSHMSMS